MVACCLGDRCLLHIGLPCRYTAYLNLGRIYESSEKVREALECSLHAAAVDDTGTAATACTWSQGDAAVERQGRMAVGQSGGPMKANEGNRLPFSANILASAKLDGNRWCLRRSLTSCACPCIQMFRCGCRLVTVQLRLGTLSWPATPSSR